MTFRPSDEQRRILIVEDEAVNRKLLSRYLEGSYSVVTAAIGGESLKGVLANVSLTPLYSEVAEMSELLRVDKDADYAAYLGRITQLRDSLLSHRNIP